MVKQREWRVHDPVSALAQPQTQVHIVEIDRKLLVETAGLVEQRAPHHHACGGYRAAVTNHIGERRIRGGIFPHQSERMPREPVDAEHDTGMLYAPVAEEQLCA